MKQKIRNINFSLILVLILIPACNLTQKPVECTQIRESELQTLFTKTKSINSKDLQSWLDTSTFKEVKLKTHGRRDDGTQTFSWIHNEIEYHALFRGDVLVNVEIFWRSRQGTALEPSGNEILFCFGQPDFYQGLYRQDIHGKILTFTLWYLEQGVIVGTVSSDDRAVTPIINGNTIMRFMTVVAPSTKEEMVKNKHTFGNIDEVHKDILKTLKPWPGTWEKIVIDVD